MPTIEELLAAANEPEVPIFRDMQELRRNLEAMSARYKGKIIFFGEERATASFPTVTHAKNFLEAARRRLKANRVGGEVRLSWRRDERSDPY